MKIKDWLAGWYWYFLTVYKGVPYADKELLNRIDLIERQLQDVERKRHG